MLGIDRGSRRGLAAPGLVLLAALLVGCSAAAQTASPSLALAEPSSAPSVASVLPSPAATSTPSPSPTDEPTASPTPSATAAPTPAPTDAAGCPILPTGLAAVRDTARAGRAIACFGHRALTFRAYVPTIEDLGGESVSGRPRPGSPMPGRV